MDMRKIGANTACFPNIGLHPAISKTKEVGFQTIELLTFDGARHSQGSLAGFWFHQMAQQERKALRKAVETFEHRATHLPFTDLPLFSYNKNMESFCRKQLCMALDASAYLGAETATMHAYARHGLGCREYWQDMLDTFRFLGDHAASHNIRLGVETGFPNTVADFTALITDINHEHVGATVDVGHIRSYHDLNEARQHPASPNARTLYNRCLIKMVELLGKKVFHVHLHDVRADDWRDHRAVGRGIVDFPTLFSLLKKMDYQSLLTFELEEPDTMAAITESKNYVASLL